MTTSDKNPRGRIAAAALSLVLLSALLIPASAVDDNTAAPAAPQFTVDALTSGALLGQIRDSIGANFGLKRLAIQSIASAHLALGVSPTPAIFIGEGGEPFLSEDFSNACSSDLEALDFAGTVDALAEAQQSAGRELLFAVVPDKSSIERDKLGPLENALLRCSDRNRDYLESLGTVVTAWDSFAASNDELYLFGDSHWNYTGASMFAVDVLDRIQPGIVQPGDLVETEQQHDGDLFVLMGVEQHEQVTMVTAERPGVETAYESETTPSGYTVQRWQSTGDAPLIPGRTLIVVDSMFGYNSQVYGPYFEDLTSVPIQALIDPGTIASMGDYDRVIVQRVQRGLPNDLGTLLTADWLT